MAKISELASGGDILDTDELVALRAGGNVRVQVAGLATQDPSNISITGGSINGTTIGAVTAAEGTFTQVNFGDNAKAMFGASDDLQIYHDGSDSIIYEGGTGALDLRSNSETFIKNGGGTETLAHFANNGAVTLYYDNSAKLATTSTGIDVTGEVEADTAHFGTGTGTGAGVADEVVVSGTGSTGLTIHSPDANNATLAFGSVADNDYAFVQGFYNSGSPFLRFSIQNSEKAKVTSTGVDVTGTVTVSGSTPTLQFTDTDNNYDATIQGLSGSLVLTADSGAEFGTESIQFKTGATERVRIDSSGNVSVTASGGLVENASGVFMLPAGELRVKDNTENGTSQISIYNNNTANDAEQFFVAMNLGNVEMGNRRTGYLSFKTNDQEHMRIDSSGNVTVGSDTANDNDAVTLRQDGTAHVNNVRLADAAGSVGGITPSIYSPASGTLAFSTNIAERMRIDSSGNVGIGTDSPAANSLTIEKSGTARLRLTESGVRAWDMEATGGDFRINNASASVEAMRIDSSGNLLVGTTNTTWLSEDGVRLFSTGSGTFTGDGIIPLAVNRLTSDGEIVNFRKDGSTVGSIGTLSGDLTIGTGITGIRFNDASDAVVPHNIGTGADRNGDIDLGLANNRFKDLYLSGGVYLGGTGAANQLDDYEEGTWTPTLPNGGTLTVQGATYTKVGRLVTVKAYIQNIAPTANTSQFQIGGLPFTSDSTSQSYGSGSISYSAGYDASRFGLLNGINNSYLFLHFIDGTSATSISNNTWISAINANSGQLILQMTYFAN